LFCLLPLLGTFGLRAMAQHLDTTPCQYAVAADIVNGASRQCGAKLDPREVLLAEFLAAYPKVRTVQNLRKPACCCRCPADVVERKSGTNPGFMIRRAMVFARS
jgi:hypothetical protein